MSIFCAISKNLQPSNENGGSEVAFYVCVLIIATLIIKSFFVNALDKSEKFMYNIVR